MTTPHIYVAIPAYSCQVNCDFAQSLFSLQAFCIQNRIGITVDMIGNESLVHRARNILCARFLKSEATHIMWIDSDIIFNPDSILKLLNHKKGVISAAYGKKAIQWEQIQKRLQNVQDPSVLTHQQIMDLGIDYNINIPPGQETRIENNIAKVLDAATGFLLIERQVLESMYEHYKDTLLCKNDIQSSGKYIPDYVALFDCMIDTNGRYLSEDYAFSRRWQAMGGDIWLDFSIPLGHVGSHQFVGEYDVTSPITVETSQPETQHIQQKP
jgi:hypothetical protein